MKVYVLEYDSFSSNKIENKNSHKIKMYLESQIGDFIADVRFNKDNFYVKNIKTYSGELKEIDINKVISPF